jgi:hypothetical protein
MKIKYPEKWESNELEIQYSNSISSDTVFFRRLSGESLSVSNEAMVASCLLPAMAGPDEPIELEGEISERFLSCLPTIQDIFSQWQPNLEFRAINVDARDNRTVAPGRIATFFSGGMDSFFTLLKHREEITDLIFIHGFDISLGDTGLRENVSGHLQEVAAHFDVGLIEVETNLRDFFSDIPWGISHGAGLATVGHLLSSEFSKLYIPSSYSYGELFPWGSHPLLDPLWSSDRLAFIHDGCEATRNDKARLISKSDIALQHLRVCWENPNSAYNCGVCEKCVRTMINLEVNGALERCDTFERSLTPRMVVNIVPKAESIKRFAQQNLQTLRENEINNGITRELQKVVSQPIVYRKIRREILKFPAEVKRCLRKFHSQD